MRALLVVVCVAGCAARPAATVLGGDVQPSTCTTDAECPPGGGTGSALLPLALIGATAVVIAASAYVYTLVRPPAHVTVSRHPGP